MKAVLDIRSAVCRGGIGLLLFSACISTSVFAQVGDTVWIAASPAGSINTAIQGDTLPNGQRAHPNRTYKLYRDSIYYFNATINVNFPISLIADPGSDRPPVIAPTILADNSSPNPFMKFYTGATNLVFRNLYFTGVRPDQKLVGQGYADCMTYTSDSTASIYSHCVFDGWGIAIDDNSGKFNKYTITDCLFRNAEHPTVTFEGDAFFANSGAPTDSVVMVNNTMFCNNAYANCNVDYNVYTLFDHNTVFLNCVNPLNDFVMTNAVYKNNIFYGTLAEAQTHSEIQQYYFENSITPSSTFSFDSLNTSPSKITIPESDRRISVFNNSVYWPAALKTFWSTSLMDTMIPPVFLNARTTAMFSDKTRYPYFSIGGNDTVDDPGFPASVMGQVDSLINYVTLYRTGGAGSYLWQYNPNGHLFAPVWPVPENLAYSNTALQHAGTDGYALGDLNWFPSQRATFSLTSVASTPTEPESYTLEQNYPNPFNPTTTIEYSIPKASSVQLVVYNILGQQVATLVNGMVAAGTHTAKFDATRLASGVYIYRIVAGNYSSARKMVLLK